MRTLAFGALYLILAWCAAAQSPGPRQSSDEQDLQTAFCPQSHQLEVAPSQKFFLDGHIGNRHVRMFLDRGGSGVVGLFFDIGGNWQITQLGGTWDNGAIDASDAGENHVATGQLKANFADNRLTGSWTAANSNQPESIELVTIPEPRCEGKEEWKRFDGPKWPVSFSFPSSWRVEQSGATITLTCPNPSEIAYDRHITIYAGTGDPDSPPDQPTELLKCGDTWRYGEVAFCGCDKPDSLSCKTARVSRKNSATILDVSDHEWRVYCLGGGYVAEGEGQDRIVLLRDHWLEINAPGDSSEILDRLIETIASRTPHHSK